MPETAAGLQPFPFPLLPDFLARLGYERAADARFLITDQLRDHLRRHYCAEGLAAFEVLARRAAEEATGRSMSRA